MASSAASQGLGARICLKSARSCLNHFTNQCKNTRGNVSRAENATEQGPSSWTGPQLSCFANSTQHPFKEHQLAVTLLRCASLQCTSVGLYKALPFVHNPACDEAFFCRLHSESSVTCQALLASEDTQREILIWSRPCSRAWNRSLCMS